MPDLPSISDHAGCRCTHCDADLSALVSSARFCPHCGVRRREGASSAPRPLPFAHGIVYGYASAMFRLGSHHEFRHNDDEAYRCYGKASRLGNEPARSRLLDIPFAARTADTDA